MTLVKSPFYSQRASGTLDGQLTFVFLRGKQWTKRKPNPKQPGTPAQTARWANMRAAQLAWKALSPADKAALEPEVEKCNLSAYHVFVRAYLLNPPTANVPTAVGPIGPFAPTRY